MSEKNQIKEELRELVDNTYELPENINNAVIKRDESEVPFDPAKIAVALLMANTSVAPDLQLSKPQIEVITAEVSKQVDDCPHAVGVEEIQDAVIRGIMKYEPELALKYDRYRQKKIREHQKNTTDDKILSVVNRKNELVKQENSNKNPVINSTQRDYIAGEVSKDLSTRELIPEIIVQAHREGILHFHDMDYFIQPMTNCCLVNLEDMLQNGTVISETMIEKPKSFYTACNIASQIIAQVASNQYGGQSFSLAHLAPFVQVSREKLTRQVMAEMKDTGITVSDDQIKKIVEKRLDKEISSGIQTIQYQLVTLMTTNGQTPFVTMFIYLDEVSEGQTRDDLVHMATEVFRQRIRGLQNRDGQWVTPAFPKIIYVLDEDNISEDAPYWDLTKLAAECTAKRMVPDYISAKVMRELKGDVYPCMGCRSFLTPDNKDQDEGLCNADNKANAGNYTKDSHKYYGRFNQGVVTINLVDVACSAVRDSEANNTDRFDEFDRIFDERLELCHKALRLRHDRLLGTPSDVAPILWQDGAYARLGKGEAIDPLLYGNYSTLSLGYCGLYEMTIEMMGVSHTSPEGKKFALKVMQHLNDKCAEWRKAENISYSLYGTPMESTTYKFAQCLQKRFGIIPNVTDHNYITNSYHVNVREKIDAFTKLKFESEFQKLSPGGAISYVEVPNLQNNLQAVLSIMKFIYENIMYAELNTKSDYCEVCGYDGEIRIVTDEKTHKLVWECPKCGNRDQNKMSVARRTCGYIGTQFWNQGRTQEIRDRIVHLSIPESDGSDLNANATK